MSTSTHTSTTGAPRSVQRGHHVAVQFSAWAAQKVQVRASGGGGQGDQPYIAVTVGECLTYVYDRDALTAHLRAWTDAAKQNERLRLPVVAGAPPAAALQAGQDMAVVCNSLGKQRHTVTGGTEPEGWGALSVVVGAVTVRVHTSEALRAYLVAWTRAQALAGILDDAED